MKLATKLYNNTHLTLGMLLHYLDTFISSILVHNYLSTSMLFYYLDIHIPVVASCLFCTCLVLANLVL